MKQTRILGFKIITFRRSKTKREDILLDYPSARTKRKELSKTNHKTRRYEIEAVYEEKKDGKIKS